MDGMKSFKRRHIFSHGNDNTYSVTNSAWPVFVIGLILGEQIRCISESNHVDPTSLSFFLGHHGIRPEAHPRPRRPDLIFREENSASSRKCRWDLRQQRRPPGAVAGVRVCGVVRSAAAARPGLRPQLCLLLDVQDLREHAPQEPTEIR